MTIRIIAAVVSSMVAFLYLASMVINWDHFGPRAKRISAASTLVFFAISYGFLEAAYAGVALGPRVFIVLTSLVTLLAALAYRFHDAP